MPIDTGTTSIHVTSDDQDIFEKYDLQDKGVGNAYHTAVEDMQRLREYRNKRKEELKDKISEIQEECEDLGINFTDITQ